MRWDWGGEGGDLTVLLLPTVMVGRVRGQCFCAVMAWITGSR
jgi:hypothetical protein